MPMKDGICPEDCCAKLNRLGDSFRRIGNCYISQGGLSDALRASLPLQSCDVTIASH